jgi:hypothetical protein
MRILGIAALAVALAGCATTPPPQTASFCPSEAAFAHGKGAAVVRGQSFLRRDDGVVVYGAGSEVLLVPKVPNSEEAVQKRDLASASCAWR